MPFSHIFTIIGDNPLAAYFMVFLIALSESLAVVGLLVPGTVLMFGVGAVVASGALSLKATLWVSIAGALAGDGISYLLGRRFKGEIKTRWPFKRHPHLLVRGEAFFQRHGGKSILFGRFVGPMRPVIPMVAGMLGMPAGKYMPINCISAVGWAFVYLLPGFFFGTSLALVGSISARLTVLILVVIATIWTVFWLFRRLVGFLARRGPGWIESFERWVTSPEPGRGITAGIKRGLYLLVGPAKGEEHVVVFLLLVSFLTGWGFLGLFRDLVTRDSLVWVDQAVLNFFQTLRSPWADHVFIAVTELGDGFVGVALGLAVLCFLLLRRCYRTAAYWAGTLLTGEALIQVFRLTIHLPRTAAGHPGIDTLGFPSGHTAGSVILFGFLAILVTRKVRHAIRWSSFGLSLLVTFMIALSRLYLGVQWLSGVLGGLSLGWVWTALAGIVYLRARPDPIPRRALALVAATVFCLAGTWHVALQHRPDRVRYAPQPVIEVTERRLWMETGWDKLPTWRVDIGGEYEQPLTLQWAGFSAKLRQRLLSQGWQFPPPFSPKTFLEMLSPETALQDLPVLPHLHNGRFEEIRLTLPAGDARWVLRLWPADLRLRGSGEPIWVGTVETQVKRRLAGFVTLAKDFGDYRSPLAGLRPTLSAEEEIVEVYRPNALHKDRFAEGLVWNGQVLLIAGRLSSAALP